MATIFADIVKSPASGPTEQILPPEAHLAREKELILLCSRMSLSAERLNRVSLLLGCTLDWEYILRVAYRNGVLALVSNALLENYKDRLPAEVHQQAADFCRDHTQRNIFLTSRLIDIVGWLNSAGIPCLPFKGPVLAMRAYKSLALRQFVDLDLLVQPQHLNGAVKVLHERGFKDHGPQGFRKSTLLSIVAKKDVGLISADETVRVELHWKLSGSFFALPFQTGELWDRTEQIALGGQPINVLPFNDLFVYLCVHAARHGFERLAWLCDLCELIETEREADWQAVCHHARSHGCEKAVELAFYIVDELFGIRPDYPEMDRIKADAVLCNASRQIVSKLFAERFGATEIGDRYLYHLMLKEKKIDRLKLHFYYILWYLKLAFRPNSADKATFALPRLFYPLYYVLRPARLLFNYFSPNGVKK